MSQAVTPVVLGPGEGHVVEGPAGGPLTFKLRGEQSGGALTVIENVIGPGDGPPLHAHANEDEAWHVIEGSLRFRLGDTLHLAPAGSGRPRCGLAPCTPGGVSIRRCNCEPPVPKRSIPSRRESLFLGPR